MYNNLLEVAEAAAQLDTQMVDAVGISAKELHFEGGYLAFDYDGSSYAVKPTKHGMKSLLDLMEINVEGGRSKIAELFNNNLTAPAAANMLNSMLRSFNNGERRMHLRMQGEQFVAAFKPDTELTRRLDIVGPFLSNVAVRDMDQNARIVRADLIDKVDLRVILDEYNGLEHHGAGVEILHSMINTNRTQINPLVKTTSCDNSLVSSAGFSLNNSRGFITRFSQSIRLVQGIVQSSIETIKEMEALYDTEYDFTNFLKFMRNDRNLRLTDPMIETLRLGARERENTLYGQVNGLTYLAHTFDELSLEQRYNFEKVAGQIVGNPTSILEYRG